MQYKPRPSAHLRLCVLSAVDNATGQITRARIKSAAEQSYTDPISGQHYQFTWRTISTWLYRFNKHGITSIDNKTRADKHAYRKVPPDELAEAIVMVCIIGGSGSGKSTMLRCMNFLEQYDEGEVCVQGQMRVEIL